MWLKNLRKNRWWLIWAICCLLITMILALCSIFNYSLIIGWLVGFYFALINCYINKLLSKKMLIKNKRQAFWHGIIKGNIFLIIVLAFLIAVIMINKYFQKMPLLESDLKVAFGPINIFTLLVGFTFAKIYQFKISTSSSGLKNEKIHR